LKNLSQAFWKASELHWNVAPELSADLIERGIVMGGEAPLLRALTGLVAKENGPAGAIADDPLSRCRRERDGFCNSWKL